MEVQLAAAYSTVKEMLVRNREALDRCVPTSAAPTARPGHAGILLGSLLPARQPARCQKSAPCLSPTPSRLPCPPPLPRRLIEALLDRNTMGGDDVRLIVEQHAARVDLERRAAEKAAFL